ncbi:MAG: phenylalanine--tRNA ligase subunit beta [Piscirickettsiaceae bacterium]|nr:phenylalanine--tRNA ligase subunit beta [Piscirickettsiaceae bacterium]
MKFSEKWLREWANPDFDSMNLVERLTRAGLNVDSYTSVVNQFSCVIVGEVIFVEAHPDTNGLYLCQVSVSDEEEPLSITCDLKGIRQGLKVPVAGIPHAGMLCSSKDLGLSVIDGILVKLPDHALLGGNICDYLDLEDVVIDIDLTPNRSDCLCIAGIAREVSALTGCHLKKFDQNIIEESSDKTFTIQVEDQQSCPHYLGRIIENINVNGITPLWMKEKLRCSGLRSLGPVIDVTNYVMLELGQPIHAFNLDSLHENIIVRMAKKNENLTLLDGKKVMIKDDTLIISDELGPLALAGIIGGKHSGVDNETKHLFLESAFFNPTAIAGRARSYGVNTYSSHRFERGVDPNLSRIAIDRATSLLLSIVGGEAGKIIELISESDMPKKRTIHLRSNQIKRVLGITIANKQVLDIFTRLSFIVKITKDGWDVAVPSFRFDLSIEVDLIEELIRLQGYDSLPKTRPQVTVLQTNISECSVSIERLQNFLVNRDYQEAITYSFIDPTIHQYFLLEGMAPIVLANPIAANLSDMRTSLWPGLIQALVYNRNRQHERVRLFEVGYVYTGTVDKIKQYRHIGGVLCGSRYHEQWSEKQRPINFFDVKSDVEALLSATGGNIIFVAEQHLSLHPGQSARIYKNNQAIGWLGTLHPSLNKPLSFDNEIYVFELVLSTILISKPPSFKSLSRFPENRRDLAILVDHNITAGEIERCLNSVKSDIIRSIQVFDVYTGSGIKRNKKSIAIAFRFQHEGRTLTDQEVDILMKTVIQILEQQLKVIIRS